MRGRVRRHDRRAQPRGAPEALEAVANLTHRGAVSADGKTGDGAGVLTQIPYRLLAPELHRLGARVTRHTDIGVGMIFLPRDSGMQACARAIIEGAIIKEGLVCGSPSGTAAPWPSWKGSGITDAST